MDKETEYAVNKFRKALEVDKTLAKSLAANIASSFCHEWNKDPLTIKVFDQEVKIDPLHVEEVAKRAAENFIKLMTSI